MPSRRTGALLVVLGTHLSALSAVADASTTPPGGKTSPSLLVGTCAFTHVRRVETRLEDASTHRAIAHSGSAVVFANGLHQVSYDQIRAVDRSRAGDPVYVCLMKLPRNCPPGDRRGKIYTTTNLRTQESWTLPDSEHQCGGA
jgi:hypothetical protein